MSTDPDQCHQTNPYVFVVGCPRSGTTLLQRMLDNHPKLAVANDTHFITTAARQDLQRNPDPPLSDELVERVRQYYTFHRMGLEDHDVDLAAARSTTYSEFVAGLYTQRGVRHKKPLSGEKTPRYCRQIPKLHALFPKARFINIIRDGRDTAMSALNWANENKGPGKWVLWATDSLGTCALWWKWHVEQGMEAGQALEYGLYHELQYEDLVADPESVLRTIADFLHLPYSPDMANYFAGKTRNNPNLSAKSAWLPPTKGLRDWRRQMEEKDIAVFEGIAGPLLRKMGYELSGAERTGAVERRINHCLDWWQGQKMSKS